MRFLTLYFIFLLLSSLTSASVDLENSENNILILQNNSETTPITLAVSEKKIELPFTELSKTPVIRYPNGLLPKDIQETIEYIDFQKDSSIKGQTFIYFNLPAGIATVNLSQKIATYIMSRDEWIGDRTLDSIAAEIYIHWVADNAEPLFQNNPFSQGLWKQLIIGEDDNRPSPLHPTHLGFYYAGLDKSNPMDAFLLTL